MTDDHVHVAFMCVQNAGRSQIATAYAERERQRRGLTDTITIHTGGTNPADNIHDIVLKVMAEQDIDLSDRTPQPITTEDLATCDYIATMGCSTLDLNPGETIDIRDWDLPDPHNKPLDDVREIRDAIEANVIALFDDIVIDLAAEST